VENPELIIALVKMLAAAFKFGSVCFMAFFLRESSKALSRERQTRACPPHGGRVPLPPGQTLSVIYPNIRFLRARVSAVASVLPSWKVPNQRSQGIS